MSEDLTNGEELLRLVFQLEQLQRVLKPRLPEIGTKLVSDLISTGVTAKAIARSIGRSPSYIRAVASGQKSLTASGIVRVVQFAAAERKSRDADSK